MDTAPNRLPIAKPCAESWNEMHGDERRRFCEKCGLHVHNLSAMNSRQREHFIENRKANDCIAYVAVADDRILVPEEKPMVSRLVRRVLAWGLALITPIFGVGFTRRLEGAVDRVSPPIEVMAAENQEAPVTAGVPVPGRPMPPPTPTPSPKPPNHPKRP